MDLKVEILASRKLFAWRTPSSPLEHLSLSITEIGQRSCRRAHHQFHFFNPPPVMELLSRSRSLRSTTHARDLPGVVKRLGKTPIVVRDTPGFSLRRL
jgi:3-hydroxyacyl-CoA dehydrogenase